jgi:putative transposase
VKASKFTDAQKAFILKQGSDGIPVADLCRKAIRGGDPFRASPLIWRGHADCAGLQPRTERPWRQSSRRRQSMRKLSKQPAGLPNILAIDGEIRRICSLDLAAVRIEWRAAFKKEPPAALSRDLLLRQLAWHAQEQAFGGHDPETLRTLMAYGRRDPSKVVLFKRLKPGTAVVREYQGDLTGSFCTKRNVRTPVVSRSEQFSCDGSEIVVAVGAVLVLGTGLRRRDDDQFRILLLCHGREFAHAEEPANTDRGLV